MSEYVVIAGLSGGGRTEASRTFEDLGDDERGLNRLPEADFVSQQHS